MARDRKLEASVSFYYAHEGAAGLGPILANGPQLSR
jgi:hypothetical protein